MKEWCFNSLTLCKIVVWLLVRAVAWIEDSFITAAKSLLTMKLKSKAPPLYFLSWNKFFFLIMFIEFSHSEQHANFAFAWVRTGKITDILIGMSQEKIANILWTITRYWECWVTCNCDPYTVSSAPVLCKTLKGRLVNEAVLWWFTIYADLLRVLHMLCVRIHLLVYKFISHSSGSLSKASCTFLLCFLWIHQCRMFVTF